MRAQALLCRSEADCAPAAQRLESARSVLRTLAGGSGAIVAHDLQRAHQYARSQAAVLAELTRVRDRNQRSVLLAQEQVSERLRELKAIERLRERLSQAEAKWQGHREQSRLDALGIIRGATSEATWPSAASVS